MAHLRVGLMNNSLQGIALAPLKRGEHGNLLTLTGSSNEGALADLLIRPLPVNAATARCYLTIKILQFYNQPAFASH